MIFKTYKNLNDEDCVIIDNGDGSYTSMLKSAYDEMIKQQTAKPVL